MGNHSFARQRRAEDVNNGFARKSMEPIAPDALPPEVVSKRKTRRMLGQRAVKRGIETCYLGHAWKLFFSKTNHLKRGRQVNRSKTDSCCKLLQHLRRNRLVLTQ